MAKIDYKKKVNEINKILEENKGMSISKLIVAKKIKKTTIENIRKNGYKYDKNLGQYTLEENNITKKEKEINKNIKESNSDNRAYENFQVILNDDEVKIMDNLVYEYKDNGRSEFLWRLVEKDLQLNIVKVKEDEDNKKTRIGFRILMGKDINTIKKLAKEKNYKNLSDYVRELIKVENDLRRNKLLTIDEVLKNKKKYKTLIDCIKLMLNVLNTETIDIIESIDKQFNRRITVDFIKEFKDNFL
ncbi:hypothetical protein [Clostridium thermobutyricum]|uniref:hypothetical protein n=1 Tax=Clostridium thermobutyricum TaxID=29372 RepID=UPI0029423C98|nr:hypothetical protein [Clostridium thermobutyricum]